MTELFLHIGQPKTGTTYIQNALALSNDAFEELRIFYPVAQGLKKEIVRNHAKINSGTAVPFDQLTETGWLEDTTIKDKLLLSNEHFFRRIADCEKWDDTIEKLSEAFTNIHVLLFVRDPIEFCASSYVQAVKRGGYTQSFDTFLKSSRYPMHLRQVIEKLFEKRKIAVSIYNYSRERRNIIALFENWLGVPNGALTKPSVKVINRGLTRRELEIQKLVNKIAGISGHLFADHMCQLAPNRQPYVPQPSSSAVKHFKQQNHRDLMELERLLPSEAALSI